MALRGQHRRQAERFSQRPLHECLECDSRLVHPVDWEEAGRGRWTVALRCPNCHWAGHGTFDQGAVDDFDQELDLGAQALVRDLRELARANMERDVERFLDALAADAILPEDF